MVPSTRDRSARCSAVSLAIVSEGIVAFEVGGWEKTARWVTPRGPLIET